MKKLLAWPGWFVGLLLALVATFAVLSLDWRKVPPPAPPRVVQAFQTSGPLVAGAASVELTPPFPTPIGGFANRGNEAFDGTLVPPRARALVVRAGGRAMALVSVELVVLPRSLRDKVVAKVADLKLDDVTIAATHSHASVGGYWDTKLASLLGLGSYEPRIEEFLVDRLATAIREADRRARPATVAVGRIEASHYGANRDDPKGPVDRQLTGARIVGADGQPIAQLVVFSAHPTILPPSSMRLSADWPGAMSASLERDGGVALFFQGDVGDTTWAKRGGAMARDERMLMFGEAVASDARGALAAGGPGEAAVRFDHARVRFQLPPCDASGAVPFPFSRLASNLMHWDAYPGTTEVSFTRLGPLAIAAVPGEIVAELGIGWQHELGATIVGLADDYVGYVDTPSRIRARAGEAQRSYFGPTLGPKIFEALKVARGAAGG